ncbi:reductive dehalogenase [Dehalogenimonas etheniformans]|uniref:Reductive dehalogenase n=1 Tax=Dehalogenimonas etheniformans TaxID=1536648 RepID=A0A2P5PA27_9CHLR|nr:reductive dehalogenase [Dehalogenimonas etheniformans]PPD59166.1 reductive dehalogenase [Dehalogenimonas etheniformans]QNT75791.1 reductive dehalogenase [Dehalogenimonas etheniformans]
MSTFHATVNRREFMKGLGLAGAGLGMAATSLATDSAFHDLDEALASPTAVLRKPWWVKLVDEPTVPIDWSMIKPGRTRLMPVTTPAQDNLEPYLAYFQKQFPDWKPSGHWSDLPGTHTAQLLTDMRWDAITHCHPQSSFLTAPMTAALTAAGQYTSAVGKPSGWGSVFQPSWKERGYSSRWEGTPEENLRTMTVLGRMAGAEGIGAIEIDDNFKRLMWGRSAVAPAGTAYEWGDVDNFVFEPSERAPKRVVIPNKCKWFLHWTQKHPYFQGNQYCANAGYEGIVQEHAYNRLTLFSIQESMISLGYLSLQWASGIMPSGPTGVLAGTGEQCRQGTPMQPLMGLQSRVMWGFFTDMPLAPTKPIDFGGYKFCHTCAICAEECTFQSIPYDDPTWAAPESYQYADRYNPGYLAWRNDTTKCHHCPVCMTVCPFTRNGSTEAVIHNVVRATAGTTSVFNSFFASMNRSFGSNKFKHPDTIWDADIYPWGLDTGQDM